MFTYNNKKYCANLIVGRVGRRDNDSNAEQFQWLLLLALLIALVQ